MTTIEIGNVHSRLRASANVLDAVQYYVSYREEDLPPSLVQAAMKSHFDDHGRQGGHRDLIACLTSGYVRNMMEQTDFDPERLTVRMIEQVLRQRGCWDGWRTGVTPKGFFATGLLRWVVRALELRCGVQATLHDFRPTPPPRRPLGRDLGLFSFQQEAVDAWLAEGRGVWDLPPRSGKTRAAVAAVAALGLPTTYIVPGKGLAKQTAEVFNALLGPGTAIAVTGGRQSQKRERLVQRTLVVVTTAGTAVKLPGCSSRPVLILDEFHHAAAKTWRDVSKAAKLAWWRLGMTGTHFRADGLDMVMAGVLGRAVYSRSVTDMVGLGRLVPARIAMLRVPGRPTLMGEHYYTHGVVQHPERNATLVWAADQLMRRGKRVLGLVKEKAHGRAIVAQLPGTVFVSGEDHAAVDKAVDDLQHGRIKGVVGTTVIGEGRDIPGADALVYFKGGKTPVGVTQDYFRVLTASLGKTHGIVVDAADCHDEVLHKHAATRLQLYREESAFTTDVMEWGNFEAWLGG